MNARALEPITEEEVLRAQQAWADAVVRRDVEALLDLYDFERPGAPLLFKPTQAPDIRTDRAGARSYFVGGDPRYPYDHGFLNGTFRRVTFRSELGPRPNGCGLAWDDMGHYVFETPEGEELVADYTFSYHRVNGRVLITLHHSSFIYQPQAPVAA